MSAEKVVEIAAGGDEQLLDVRRLLLIVQLTPKMGLDHLADLIAH